MQRIISIYRKYPMITTSLVAFFAQFPITAAILVPTYFIFGNEAYSYLFTPVLCAECCCYLFALRRAILIHIRRNKGTTGKGKFYRRGYYVVSFGFYLFLLATVAAIFGFA